MNLLRANMKPRAEKNQEFEPNRTRNSKHFETSDRPMTTDQFQTLDRAEKKTIRTGP